MRRLQSRPLHTSTVPTSDSTSEAAFSRRLCQRLEIRRVVKIAVHLRHASQARVAHRQHLCVALKRNVILHGRVSLVTEVGGHDDDLVCPSAWATGERHGEAIGRASGSHTHARSYAPEVFPPKRGTPIFVSNGMYSLSASGLAGFLFVA